MTPESSVEATVRTTKLGLAGLGYWGPNLARNFDDLADLAWLCDVSPDLVDRYGARYPSAATTDRFDDLLEDSSVQAVVIATPVSTGTGRTWVRSARTRTRSGRSAPTISP